MITEAIVKDAGNKGMGIFALRNFTRGDFIFRCRYGRIIAKGKYKYPAYCQIGKHKSDLVPALPFDSLVIPDTGLA